MNSIRLFYNRAIASYAGRICFILVLFLVCRLLSLLVFYEGFLHTFQSITTFIFGKHTPALLSHVPYHSSSILFSSLLNPFFCVTLLLFYVPFFLKRKALREATFTFTGSERLIIFAAAFLLAWEFFGYNYNYFLDRPFYFDRVLLLVLAFLLIRFPLLTPLFVAWTFAYRSQFNYPVDGFPLYDKRLLFDLLVMFVAFVYTRLYIPAFKLPYIYFAVCVLASGYFMGAAIKVVISPHGYEWLFKNNPVDLFYNVYHKGWLAHSSESTVNLLANFFTRYGKLFQAIAFFIELSALFMLYSRKAGIIILWSLLAMHTGIFFLAGIFFWKWMIIDLVLLFCYYYKKGILVKEAFQKPNFKASALIICLAVAWLQPVKFGWHDTPVNQFFTYEVEDENGTVYPFEKNEMNPYHQWFQMDRFLFLVNKPCLPLSGFGYTGRYSMAKAIKKSGPEHFMALEQEKGKNTYELPVKEEYDTFIATYFKNRNARLGRSFWPSAFMAPLHLYNYEKGNVWKGQARVRLFRVIFNQVYTQNGKAEQLFKQTVDEVLIPG
jgi:hypothetical protein